MQALTGREGEFARRLAVSDKVSRDRALKKLRTWLHARSQPTTGDFDIEEMMKIWRGLHYCMWMSDKPLIQEECAANISSLVHSLATDFTALQFVDCGWLILCQEWVNIDRLRIDKYMMLMRHYLRQNFAYLQKHKWRSALVDEMMRNFSFGILDPTTDQVPLGIQLHLTDIYLDVLKDLAEKENIPWKVLRVLLRPALELMAKTVKPVVLKAACSGIGDALLEVSSVHEDDSTSTLKVDHGALAEMVFALASESSVSQKNRAALYLLKRGLESVAVTHASSSSCVSSCTDESEETMAERDAAAAEPGDEPMETSVAAPQPGKKRKRKKRRKSPEEAASDPQPEKKRKSAAESKSPLESKAATPVSPETTSTPQATPGAGSPKKKKRIRLSLENTTIKEFSKKDPIDVSPWKPTSKEGKSLLKNRTPTPITPKMRRILALGKAKVEAKQTVSPTS